VNEANRNINKHQRVGLDKLVSLAEALDPFRGSDEAAWVAFRDKPNNGVRCVFSFGIENRSLQHLILPLLHILHTPHANQYLTQGGVHRAVATAAAAQTNGYRWASETDIKDCYPSVGPSRLAQCLPLPKEVIERSIISRHLRIVPSVILGAFGSADPFTDDEIEDCFGHELAIARRGIPQGSATSPILIEHLLTPVFGSLPSLDVVTINYSDNTLVMGRSMADVETMTEALCAALKLHSAGQFQPTLREFDAGPINFLGHRLETTSGGGTHIAPSSRNRLEFHHKLDQFVRTIRQSNSHQKLQAHIANEARTYVRSWCGAFSLCWEAPAMKANAMREIQRSMAKA